jgi:hypothetical protein
MLAPMLKRVVSLQRQPLQSRHLTLDSGVLGVTCVVVCVVGCGCLLGLILVDEWGRVFTRPA